MESLVLALGLRVIGSAVADPDTESQEPDGEDGVGIVRVISPRRAVVHEHPDGKAMMAEQAGQGGLNGLVAFIGTGNQSESIAGVVVEDGERMVALVAGHADVSLEVHLPEVVARKSVTYVSELLIPMSPAQTTAKRIASQEGDVEVVVVNLGV